MKKSFLALILVVLIVPLAQAFFPFTGFTTGLGKDKPSGYTCPDNYEKTAEYSCIPKCTEKTNYIEYGNKKLYSYCFDSKVLYESTCKGKTPAYNKIVCPRGCKDGRCQEVEKCIDQTLVGSCSVNLNSYCNQEKQIINCNENQICRNGQCTTSNDCSKNNGFIAKTICPKGFKPIPSTLIEKEIGTQCCIPIEQKLPVLTTIDEQLTCEDETPVGKCSETRPYLCTYEQVLVRDCTKCGCPLNQKCDAEDSMVCTEIKDATEELYDAIKIEEEIKPILYAPSFLPEIFKPTQMIPSYLLSPPTTSNEPVFTHAHIIEDGLFIESGTSSFTIKVENNVPIITFKF